MCSRPRSARCSRAEPSALGDGLLRLLVVSRPGKGGGELAVRISNLRDARDRLLAPWDRLLPLREVVVQDARMELPPGPPDRAGSVETRSRPPQNHPRRGQKSPSETDERMCVGVVWSCAIAVSNSVMMTLTAASRDKSALRIMSPRILGPKGQGGVGHFLVARNVACWIVAPAIEHAIDRRVRQNGRASTFCASRASARSDSATLSFEFALVAGRLDSASACIARSAAFGLLGRSRIARKASA